MPIKPPLRVLATAYDYRPRTGGIATCAYELCRALAQRPDIELRVLARAASGSQEFDRHGIFPTTRAHLSQRTELASAQIAVHLARACRRHPPDAILNFLWLPEAVGAALLNCVRSGDRIPYFPIVHGVEVLESTANFRKRARMALTPWKHRVFQSAEAVFAVSGYTRELVAENCGVPLERIHEIYNGVDSNYFRPGPKPEYLLERHHLHGKQVLLSVTRLVDYKGVDFALRAFARVVERHPQAVYLVGGVGDDRARLVEITRECGIESRVLFVGAIPSTELVDYYNLADAFVLLSRDDLVTPNVEGFGIVFLEAAACAKPSIAGRSGGVPDAVGDETTGWLVNPADTGAIAYAMDECLADPQATAVRGRNARTRAERDFSWSRVAERVAQEMHRYVRD